jgi:hypothetical protein
MKISCVLGAAAGLMLVAGAVNADVVQTFSFYRITNNASMDVGSQLQMEVSAALASSTQVTFTFANLIGVSSNVTEIYFDSGPLAAPIVSVVNAGGTSVPTFTGGSANPGNLPGGNTLPVPFVASTGLLADIGSGSSGLNENADRVAITFNLLNGKTWADTIDALRLIPAAQADWLRVGLHVRSINGGTSDAYLNIVPLPPAAWAGIASLAGVFGVGYVRRRSFRS